MSINKDSQKVPNLRFKGFTDDWELCKLSSLMDFSNGINAPKENYGKGRKMISVMDILSKNPILYKNIRNSVEVDEKTEGNNKVKTGDIVFVRSSEVRKEVGWAKAYLDNNFALFSGFTIRGKKVSEFDAFFIELSINGKNRNQIERNAGGSIRFNVSQSILKNMTVYKPSLSEQFKVSKFFKTLDDTITLHQRKLDQLNQLKEALLQKMFPDKGETVPKLRFAGFEGAWEERKLGDLLNKNIEKNKDLSIINVESVSNKTGFTKQIEQFENYSVASADLSNYYVIREQQFAYNPSRINVGSIAYKALGDDTAVVSPLYVSFSTKRELNDGFIWNWFKTTLFDAQRKRLSEGGVRDTLSFNQLSVMDIILPTYLEQEKISGVFKQLDNAITLQQRKLDQLQNMKQVLLQNMFI